MADRELTAFRLDGALLQALRFVKERDALPVSEQVRRAVEVWLKTAGANLQEIHAAFDDLDTALTIGNPGDDCAAVRLPQVLGPLGRRLLGTLSAAEFEKVERMATAVGRNNPWYRRCWKKATAQRSAAQRKA
jgi:hypothetical protein